MSRGRKPKSLKWLERHAVVIWSVVTNADTSIVWADRSARLFGMGEALHGIGELRAAEDAFFLSSLAEHIERGDLPLPSQPDFAMAGGAG